MATFTIYRDKAGEFRWRLQAANNRIISDSGEGCKNRSDCRDVIDLIKNDAPHAAVHDET